MVILDAKQKQNDLQKHIFLDNFATQDSRTEAAGFAVGELRVRCLLPLRIVLFVWIYSQAQILLVCLHY